MSDARRLDILEARVTISANSKAHDPKDHQQPEMMVPGWAAFIRFPGRFAGIQSPLTIRQYSLWDTLGESARIRDVWSSTPDGVRMRRMVNRTRLFDAFGSSIDQTGALSDADRERLVRVYRRRARTWHVHLDSPATVGREASPRGNWLDDVLLAWIDEGFILVLAALIIGGVAFGLLFVPAFVLPWYYIKVRKLHRCRMAVEKKICPDCEYDLTGCPEAIEPEWVHGVSVGPRRCPECSAPWPLLPPPSRSGVE